MKYLSLVVLITLIFFLNILVTSSCNTTNEKAKLQEEVSLLKSQVGSLEDELNEMQADLNECRQNEVSTTTSYESNSYNEPCAEEIRELTAELNAYKERLADLN